MGALAAAGPAGASAVQALPGQRLVPGDTVWATPGAGYAAGSFHRFVLGDGYRDLWTVPVPAQVLDLDTYAGGLTLEGLGGGNQTRSLRFVSADGTDYNFRSIDKDASRALDPELRRSVAAWILQDQISSLFPLSAMVVEPLLEAVDVLHPHPELRVMPDDPRLGEFREEFAGMLGWIEERPNEGEDGTAGFAGSVRVVGSDRLFELLEESPEHRLDARALLKARLVDVLVGDWDRHPDQWRWARFDDDEGYRYAPIPRDRDWSLARIDGALTWFTWMPWPQYMGFGPELGTPFRRTFSGQVLDRMLLTGLSWPEWQAVTDAVVAALSDAVIDEAVATLPEPHEARVGDSLRGDLKRRRDGLSDFARGYYDLLAGWVDVHTTDEDELAVVTRSPGDIRVAVYLLDDGRPVAEPHYDRTFRADETREVRLDLHGGDDRVRVEGRGGGIVVRVIGGGGDDAYDDRTDGSAVAFYDEDGGEVAAGSATGVDDRDWDEPYDPRERTDWVPARDWGHRSLPIPVVGYSSEWGAIVGLGVRREWYGFRRWPYRAALEGGLGLATETGRPVGHAELDLPLAGAARFRVRGEVAGAEVRRWFGVGNSTALAGDDDLYEAERRKVGVSATAERPVGGGVTLTTGLAWRRFDDLGNPGTLVDRAQPYGFPEFRQLEVTGGVRWEGEDPEGLLNTPSTLAVDATWFPATLDVEEGFGALEARGSATLPFASDAAVPPVLALRAGGRTTWGRTPYHESALLGGRSDLRGYHNQRFAGHASLFANAELRLAVGRVFLLLPGDAGVFGLVDAGRVFSDEPEAGTWHTAVGGGVWLSFLDAYSATLALARGEITGVYATVGFPF